MGVSGQLHGPTALYPGTTVLVPTEYKARWVPQPVWIRNISTALVVNQTAIPQLSSHNTNYAITAPNGVLRKYVTRVITLSIDLAV
jgi:hypothetical protein